MNILIVDDEKFVSENLKLKINRLQHHFQYNVFTESSARQGLLAIKNHSIDIVFTDIHMPFVTGITFIKMLKLEGFKGGIFVLSGYDMFEYVREAFLLGIQDYLLKPVSMSQLNEKLLHYYQSASPQEAGHLNDTTVTSSTNPIDFAIQYMNEHYHKEDLSMLDVANYVSLSYSHFSKLFKKETNLSFPSYLMNIRLQKAIELLADPYLKITEICYKVGFKSPQQFSRDFNKHTGQYPLEYRKNQ